MSLDGAMLNFVREELSALVGSRVEKVYQPARDEIVVGLRTLSGTDRSAKKILFSANSAGARVCLTRESFENPAAPPMFCMLLRKHLSGGRLVGIRQDGLERILNFDFECVNEIGDTVVNTLCAEVMGRASNVILLRGERVVDSIRRVSEENRRILPNIVYEPPAREARLGLFEDGARAIVEKIENDENLRRQRLAKSLMSAAEGIAPIFARECAFAAGGDVDAVFCELDESGRARLREFLENAKNAVFCEILDENGAGKDFSFVEIKQYGESFRKRFYESANELVDGFFAGNSAQSREKQRSKELVKLVKTRLERAQRTTQLRKKELSDCARRTELQKTGDLISANLYKLKKGMTSARLEDFYSGRTIEVSLDARLSPAQNAQKYYSEYKKLCAAECKLTELIKTGGDEISYLESVLDSLTRASSEAELAEIRRELAEQGYIRGIKNEKRPKKLSEPMKYVSSDGFVILVGKNNRQNDELTLKTAKAHDIWLHTKNIAGSHVIIATDGREAPERTIEEAAMLAAFHSKARESSGVAVDYTAVKFVKKPAGAKPGMVIFTNNKTLYVTPDGELINKLRIADLRKEKN